MASTRVINYISCRRLAAMSNLANARVILHFTTKPSFPQNASYCTKKVVAKSSANTQDNKVQVGFAEVVKENTKSAAYLGVIIVGLGIVVFMFYEFYNEVVSSKSPNGVCSRALDYCKKNPKVVDALGEPIKAFGEETRRGRRNHISYVRFMKDNVPHMRMKFYVQGIRRRGTVTLEVEENEAGEYVYRYLYVIIEDLMKTIIKIEDNRERHTSYSDDSELELS